MVQMESILDIADNTGAKKLKMIRRLGQLKGTATVGDVIVGSVVESTPDAAFKKGKVVRAVIVRVAFPLKRADGQCVRFDKNACVIIDPETKNPKGTRIFGAVARELRGGFMKIVSLAQEVL
ncbi:MAG: 50S ribosomal protein L14 [Phototrophicales bacterium]|nr:MAG: 50S ribosomal protein L14 [Phototrophicales bacterium]